MKVKWRSEVAGFKDAVRIAADADDPESRFEESRDAIVAVLKGSAWYADSEEYGELWSAVEDLRDAPTIDDVDEALQQVYDLADDERVWLGL